MWLKNTFICVLILTGTVDATLAQTVADNEDTTGIYQNIESYANRGKFTKFLHKLVFKPVAPGSTKMPVYKKLIQKPYSDFEDKIIRHIIIETLDPFGYAIADTTKVPDSFFTKTGNMLHLRSRPKAIRNLLLFKQNQHFDSLLVKESERLVRSQIYVHDVSFYVKAASTGGDSVDIFIRELDTWSIIPKITSTSSHISLNVVDNNFSGLGHRFENQYSWYHSGANAAFYTHYFVPNIRNTFVSVNIKYGTDEFRNFNQSFGIDRPFFSPFTRWAGGIFLSQQLHKDSIWTIDSLFVGQRNRFNTQDYWAGIAVQIFKGNSLLDRTTNMISALRYYRINFIEKPIETLDTEHSFWVENFYLASIGISTRNYVQDKFIFDFGLTEDVPVGKVYSLTVGYQERNLYSRIYVGAGASFGRYHPWGYLSTNFEYGAYYHLSQVEQGVVKAGINYFTGLFEIGNWKFRQFVKPQLIIGLNRFYNDSLTLKDGYGLNGFNSSGLSGTNRFLFTLQTQSYAPWDVIGFRFGPYFICSIGLLGNAETGFNKSRMYSEIGIGVLIKNDFLVINTFQISLAFYPSIPGNGQNIFKINSFKTNDFGFRDFVIGKPAPVVYQ